jgi:hypothetical protein
MNNGPLEQLSFSLDLLNLDRKLSCEDASVDDDARSSVYLVEEALRANGVRLPIDKNAK